MSTPVPVLPLRLMRIPVTIIHIIAIGATLFRLNVRFRRQNVWWDDGLAGFVVVLDIMYLITFWLRNENAGQSPPETIKLYIILNWFHLMLGTTILWLARISIMLGITRIILPWGKLRRFALCVPFIFIAFWLVVLSQKIWVCARTNEWHSSKSVQCFLAQPVPAVEISFDLLADATLFFIPARTLWNINLSPAARRLVLGTFAASILVTLANIVYITFMLGSIHWGTFLLVAVTAHIEATVALTVCNSSVLIPAAYRAYKRFRGKAASSSDEEDTHPPRAGLGDTELADLGSSYWTMPRFLRNITISTHLGDSTADPAHPPGLDAPRRFTVSLTPEQQQQQEHSRRGQDADPSLSKSSSHSNLKLITVPSSSSEEQPTEPNKGPGLH